MLHSILVLFTDESALLKGVVWSLLVGTRYNNYTFLIAPGVGDAAVFEKRFRFPHSIRSFHGGSSTTLAIIDLSVQPLLLSDLLKI